MRGLCAFLITPVGPRDMQGEGGLAYAVVITGLRDLSHSFNLLLRGWGAQSCWFTFGLVVILFLHLQNSPLNPGV